MFFSQISQDTFDLHLQHGNVLQLTLGDVTGTCHELGLGDCNQYLVHKVFEF